MTPTQKLEKATLKRNEAICLYFDAWLKHNCYTERYNTFINSDIATEIAQGASDKVKKASETLAKAEEALENASGSYERALTEYVEAEKKDGKTESLDIIRMKLESQYPIDQSIVSASIKKYKETTTTGKNNAVNTIATENATLRKDAACYDGFKSGKKIKQNEQGKISITEGEKDGVKLKLETVKKKGKKGVITHTPSKSSLLTMSHSDLKAHKEEVTSQLEEERQFKENLEKTLKLELQKINSPDLKNIAAIQAYITHVDNVKDLENAIKRCEANIKGLENYQKTAEKIYSKDNKLIENVKKAKDAYSNDDDKNKNTENYNKFISSFKAAVKEILDSCNDKNPEKQNTFGQRFRVACTNLSTSLQTTGTKENKQNTLLKQLQKVVGHLESLAAKLKKANVAPEEINRVLKNKIADLNLSEEAGLSTTSS